MTTNHRETTETKLLGLLGAAAVPVEVWQLSRENLLSGILIPAIFLLLVVSYWSREVNPYLAAVWRWVSWILRNLFLWVLGNAKEHGLLNDIHRWTLAEQESSLFGKLAEMKGPVDCYHIFFTHKGEEAHRPTVGDWEHYKMPGFPFDEAELILRLSYFVANNLSLDWSGIKIRCSCAYATEKTKGAMTIIGSPTDNLVCKELMRRIIELEKGRQLERLHKYTMEIAPNGGPKESCYLRGHAPADQDLRPDPTFPPPRGGSELTDYAMLMKVPNLSGERPDKNKTIMLFAGCRVAGQVALTEWISKPDNLVNLVSRFSEKSFYSIFAVRYKYVPQALPIIISISPCKDSNGNEMQGEISFGAGS